MNLEIEELLLFDPNDIVIYEEERIRERTPFVDSQINSMAESFKSTGQVNPIIIDEENFLISGYIRLMAARKLGMQVKVIKKLGLTIYQKLQIEMQENVIRGNFTSYEYTIGLARLKRAYEREHPETSWGKNPNSRVARGATPQKNIPLSFAEQHAKLYLHSRRAILDRCRVGEAILDGEFDEETINLFKEDKITFTELRERKKARDRLKSQQKKLLKQKSTPKTQIIAPKDQDYTEELVQSQVKEESDTPRRTKKDSNKRIQESTSPPSIIESLSESPLPSEDTEETSNVLKEIGDKNNEETSDVSRKIQENQMQELLVSIDKAETPQRQVIQKNCAHIRIGICPDCFAQICACKLELKKGQLIIRHSCPKDCAHFD